MILNISKALKITIITVCKNSEQFLVETIESVISQTYHNIEYIVIDGNSTDATVDIIKKYADKISYWVSEKDGGMYDAINKGLKTATGDYILVLNSDDVLAGDHVIKTIAEEIQKDGLDYYYGNIIKLKGTTNKKVKLFPVNFRQLLFSTHGTFVPHPCFFISNKLNHLLGGYNLKFKYASDYDYILRVLNSNGATGKYLDVYVTKFRIHNNSITASGKIDEERKKILLQHGYYQQPYLKRIFYYYLLWVYYKIINIKNR